MDNTVSLCMIVKNKEKFLSKCLESIKDYVDEIIVHSFELPATEVTSVRVLFNQKLGENQASKDFALDMLKHYPNSQFLLSFNGI